MSFIRDVLGWKDSTLEKFSIDEQLSKSCGWLWWHENVLAISDRPCEIHRDSEGRLHNENGPSVLYRDCWSLWTLNGVFVDEQIVLRPGTQSIEQINGEQNEEVKRIRIERYGWQKYLKQVNAKVLDTRQNDIEGTREALMQTENGMMVLVCACPSTARVYSLEVAPEVRTCEQAQKWLWSGSRLLGNHKFRIIGRT